MSAQETLEQLLRYVEINNRVCPIPQRWAELWEMLPGRQRVGQGWEPALPLILAAWWDTPILPKMLRLREHIEWADSHGVLQRVDRFLRSLPEDHWAHSEDFLLPDEVTDFQLTDDAITDKDDDKDAIDRARGLIENGALDEAHEVLMSLIQRMPSDWVPVKIASGDEIRIASWDLEEFQAWSDAWAEQNPRGQISFWVRPSYSCAFYFLALIAAEREDYASAIEAVEQGLRLEPDHPLLLCEKGFVLRHLRRFEEALICYQQGVAARQWSPDFQKAQALRGVGVTLIDLGRLDEAEDALRESLRFELNNKIAVAELDYIEQLRSQRSSIAFKGDAPTAAPSELGGLGARREGEEQLIAEMVLGLMNTPVEPKQAFENLLETTEILRLAILSRDKEKAFQAVTILLMQFLTAFSEANASFLKRTFPLLEQLEDQIQAEQFDAALPYVLAFQAKFRAVHQGLKGS